MQLATNNRKNKIKNYKTSQQHEIDFKTISFPRTKLKGAHKNNIASDDEEKEKERGKNCTSSFHFIIFILALSPVHKEPIPTKQQKNDVLRAKSGLLVFILYAHTTQLENPFRLSFDSFHESASKKKSRVIIKSKN